MPTPARTNPTPPPKRLYRAKGKAIVWTDEQIEAMAIITPEDIEIAKAAVALASPKLAAILNAQPVETHAATE